MLKFMRQILRDNTGAAAVEYGLIVSLIVLAMITALGDFASKNTAQWNYVDAKMASTTP